MSLVLAALTALVLAGYLKSYQRDGEKTKTSAKYSLDILAHILPYLVIGIWLTGVFFSFIPNETIKLILDDSNILLKIPLVCLVAMIFPGPRYIIYPLAAGLALRGINIGIVVAYLTADVLIDPSCILLESKMLGKRYYIYRFILSLTIASIGGYLTYLVIPNSLMFK